MSYQPPYTITSSIVSLVADISERMGYLAALESEARTLYLRRINRIRTIQGSLAIEGNTLSQAQITAILEGKRVIAPPREIQEVRNAIKVYDFFQQWQPASEKDLLAAHEMLMTGSRPSSHPPSRAVVEVAGWRHVPRAVTTGPWPARPQVVPRALSCTGIGGRIDRNDHSGKAEQPLAKVSVR